MTDLNDNQRNLLLRLGVGLAQGLVLYLLLRDAKTAQTDMVRTALIGATIFAPTIFIQGLSTIRLPRLVPWVVLVALVCAGLCAYSVWRQVTPTLLSGLGLCLFLQPGLFIAHALVSGSAVDGRFRALYPTHFDVAWKMVLQYVLASFFVLAFWLLLFLGAQLFSMIGLTFLRRLMAHNWFYYPVTAMIAAGGLHVTDVQPMLVRGTRTLLLALFAWLLPLLTLLAGGFLLALAGTGLAPLWRMEYASGKLLLAAAILIVLINAMYQDGSPERMPHRLLRLSGQVAAAILLPLVALAGYALWLRVAQYGWTSDRVCVAACVLVAAFYAIGYLASLFWPLFRPGGPLHLIERWNFAASFLILAVLLALFTPLADPARIAVNSQVARLESGAVAPGKFDFTYLHSGGDRYGREALQRLAASPNAAIRRAAAEAQRNNYPRTQFGRNRTIGTERAIRLAPDIAIYPAGAALPPSFKAQAWRSRDDGALPFACRQIETRSANRRRSCEAVVLDMDGDGKPEVLLLQTFGTDSYTGNLMQPGTDGRWQTVARIGYPRCPGDLEALHKGQLKLVPPVQPDLQVNGRTLPLDWQRKTAGTCPVNQAP